MLHKSLFFSLMLTMAVCFQVSGQTVDDLINKNIEAHGGLAKLKAIKSIKMSGKMTLHQGMEAPFIFQKKRPHFVRVEFSLQGLTGIQAYDGEAGWMLMPFMGAKDPQKMPEEEKEDIAEQADFDGPLVDYKEKGHTLELLGKEDVEGSEAYKLKLTLKNGKVRYIYLDPESGLEIKTTSIIKREGVESSIDTFYGDYKTVDGVVFPFSIENKIKDQPGPQYSVEKVEFDVVMDDSIFQMPAAREQPSNQ